MSRGFGRVQKGCLWHLMEEGQLSVKDLVQRLDTQAVVINSTLATLAMMGLVGKDPQKVRIGEGRLTAMHGLTRKGIEAALLLDPEDAGPYSAPLDLT